MVLNKEYIIEEILNNDINVTGVLHIGAHECEEIPIYYKLGLDVEDIIWIEANPDKVKEAKLRNIPNIYEAVITDEDDKEIEFHVANNFQSSSVLELGTHAKDHPDIKYVSSFIAKTTTIKSFFKKNKKFDTKKYNFWNFDIQGAELMALQGAEDIIKNVKVINIEVNTKKVYKNCPLMSDIDSYLGKFGFKRILTKITPQGWGDALYIIPKKQIYIHNNNTFGDKVFNLIYGIYLYNLYKGLCKINYIIEISKNTKENEKTLDIVFPESKNKINYIKYENLSHYNKITLNKIINNSSKKYNSLKDFPKYENLNDINNFNDCFNLTYKMYQTFTIDDINIFQNINKSLITNQNIYLYQTIDYALIDIRYGNKIMCNKTKDDKCRVLDDTFILYTPEYYIDMMRMINPELLIIIITDSKEIIIEYILRKYYNKNNFVFIDSNDINGFYLYYNAKSIIMNVSTFSMAGSYFNKYSNKNNNSSNKNNNSNNSNYNNINNNIYYLFYRNKSSPNSLPEENAISDKWHIIKDKHYILNYNNSMNTNIYEFIKNIKFNIYKKKSISDKLNYYLNNNIILPFNYKNQEEINYNEFLFKLKINIKIKKIIKNPHSINKFYEELYFEKILNEYGIKSCLFITKNIWSSYFKRLFDYSKLKITTLYTNEHDNNGYDIHKPLLYYVNKENKMFESLILFLIKSDYGIEFDFIYDYYIFKINELLNTLHNLKLLIISYSPNLILPFTFNTLINICNHSDSYKIITVNNNVYIIFINIKNYNVEISHLKKYFINLYKNIVYLTNEDILKEIMNNQNSINSIAQTHYFKFNDNDNNNNMLLINKCNNKYTNNKHNTINNSINNNINIIKYPIKVHNENFTIDLLLNIYNYFDNVKYIFNLFTLKNIEKKELFENYYYKIYNNWNKLIYNQRIEKVFIKLSKTNKKTLKSIKKSYTTKFYSKKKLL